jgi:ribosome biogenesis GTPase
LKGLITSIVSNTYEVENLENGNVIKCVPRGKFKNNDITIAVGDRVDYDFQNEAQTEGVINEIIERTNFIKRPKMANITQMIFVISMKMPKPDLLLLDKQLAFAEFIGVDSVIVLNKIDLEDDKTIKEIANIYQKIGYKVIQTNAKTGEGIDKVKKCLKKNITAFSGNSGVGKSTLINNIFKEEITLEGNISEKNKRGKNTTTSIKLYKIDSDSYIADTPGFSTFDINEIESKDLAEYFIDLKDYIKNCEFVGCTHVKEEKCGIKEAIEKGKININRYESYCKLYNELKEKEQHKW